MIHFSFGLQQDFQISYWLNILIYQEKASVCVWPMQEGGEL